MRQIFTIPPSGSNLVFILILAFTMFFSPSNLNAQCLMVELPLNERAAEATFIIEGKVISKTSFWDEKQSNIYTSNTIEIYKIFQGDIINLNSVEIITPGGQVGMNMQVVNPSLQLNKGDIGVFFMKKNEIELGNARKENTLYLFPTSAGQSFIKYDFNSGVASGPFKSYKRINEDIYSVIETTTQKSYNNISSFNFKKEAQQYNTSLNKSITGFTPSTITAGTESILTINGSGFGATKGSVEFTNANNQSGTDVSIAALDAQIKTWTDNQITVEVPDDAGTGVFEVIRSGGMMFTSSTNLTVTYAHLNTNSDFQTGITDAYPTRLVDRNTSGGYTWQYFTDFANGTDIAGAADAFLRALNTHCQSSTVNWLVGANSAIDGVDRDGVNIVRFDNGTELPNGVLGRLSSWYRGCSTVAGVPEWYVEELDAVFDSDVNWNTGTGVTAAGQYNFEAVALHEIGHAHQLGHTLNGDATTGDIMFPNISIGVDKMGLSTNDEAGMAALFGRSTTPVCSESVMTASNCATLPVELLAFNGEAMPDYNRLQWVTASEENNAGFEVQRSKDGQNWETLDFVKGYGTTIERQQYKYNDYAPLTDISYYRLKQMDTDGAYEYSDIISLERKVDNAAALVVYPNPTREAITFELGGTALERYTFQLIDPLGRVLKSWDKLEGTTHSISVEDLSNGFYTLVAQGANNVLVKRFVKQ